ncbi:MAG: NAD(P)H-dependent glycerol-3-phosphate dehydrogenase [Flavobacteriales bacterium]
MEKVIVIGGGSWGTALCKILSDAGNPVTWYMRSERACAEFNATGSNHKYLPGCKLDTEKVHAIHSFHAHAELADVLVVAVPAAFAEQSLPLVQKERLKDKIVISAAKGMLPNNDRTLTEYLEFEWGLPSDKLFFIGGPCHAEEAAEEKRSYLTLAGNDPSTGERLAALFRNTYISCHYHAELRVVEYAAVLKNIYALGMGIAQGLGYGDNFQAVMAANAWREAERFLNRTFPYSPINLNDSACLGDLLVTCYSIHSRNRRFGNLVAAGNPPAHIIHDMQMVAEGYYAVKSFCERHGNALNEMPVVNCVYAVLYEGADPRASFRALETRLI